LEKVKAGGEQKQQTLFRFHPFICRKATGELATRQVLPASFLKFVLYIEQPTPFQSAYLFPAGFLFFFFFSLLLIAVFCF
jgi:hypothetical protein